MLCVVMSSYAQLSHLMMIHNKHIHSDINSLVKHKQCLILTWSEMVVVGGGVRMNQLYYSICISVQLHDQNIVIAVASSY